MGSVPAVSVINLKKSYGKELVLKGVSLIAEDHDVVTIIGSSGSGKSTLLRCINLLETPDAGEIRIKDELIDASLYKKKITSTKTKQLARIRSRIGMVFQNFNLWSHMNVQENVIEAPMHVQGIAKRDAIEKAHYYLNKVGMYDKRHDYPLHLSGGQKQRAAIARALAVEPQVLLLDEPTSSLDPELVGEVLKVLRDLAVEGRTMVMVTHEMNFARDVATNVIFLERGRIEEQGKPAEFFGAPKTERLQKFLSHTS